MIQVIDRAFKILLKLAEDPMRVWQISELAEIIDVPSPTCYHIVNSMVQLEMIERLGTRKGYRLGGGVRQLCPGEHSLEQIAQIAEPLFRFFVLDYKALIELVKLRGFQRHIICHASPEHILRVDYNLQTADDVLRTISGQYLLAHEPIEVQERFYHRFLPHYELPPETLDLWPYGLDYPSYLRTLAEKRDKPNVIRENVRGRSQVLFPVYSRKGNVNAVVAAVIPAYSFQGKEREKMIEELFHISNQLSAAQAN